MKEDQDTREAKEKQSAKPENTQHGRGVSGVCRGQQRTNLPWVSLQNKLKVSSLTRNSSVSLVFHFLSLPGGWSQNQVGLKALNQSGAPGWRDCLLALKGIDFILLFFSWGQLVALLLSQLPLYHGDTSQESQQRFRGY